MDEVQTRRDQTKTLCDELNVLRLDGMLIRASVILDSIIIDDPSNGVKQRHRAMMKALEEVFVQDQFP